MRRRSRSLARQSWVPSTWYLAQVVHVLAGALVVYAAGTHGLNLAATLVYFVGATAIKEFVVDVSSFEQASWSGSAQDFLAYQAGGVCGLAALGHFWAGAAMTSVTVFVLFACDYTGRGKTHVND